MCYINEECSQRLVGDAIKPFLSLMEVEPTKRHEHEQSGTRFGPRLPPMLVFVFSIKCLNRFVFFSTHHLHIHICDFRAGKSKLEEKQNELHEAQAGEIRRNISIAKAEIERLRANRKMTKRGRKTRKSCLRCSRSCLFWN